MTAEVALVLDAAAVEALLSRIDVSATLRSLFCELGEGRAVQPAQTITLFPDGAGDVIAYQGVLAGRGVFGAKLSPYIVTGGKPVITAWTCLMSMTTGRPLLLCDSGQLTTERTAGTTALAIDELSPSSATRLAIIGSGPIAQAHWRHVRALRPWTEVRLWSPSLANKPDRLSAWRAECPDLTISENAEAAAREADVVMLCTSSGQPVIDVSALAVGALVTSISTNVPQAHEVPPAFLTQAQVYCDYRATTPTSAGEMVLAAQDQGWDPATIRGDLAELVTGTCPRPEPGRSVFFRSIGLGLEDIAMAEAIHHAATSA